MSELHHGLMVAVLHRAVESTAVINPFHPSLGRLSPIHHARGSVKNLEWSGVSSSLIRFVRLHMQEVSLQCSLKWSRDSTRSVVEIVLRPLFCFLRHHLCPSVAVVLATPCLRRVAPYPSPSRLSTALSFPGTSRLRPHAHNLRPRTRHLQHTPHTHLDTLDSKTKSRPLSSTRVRHHCSSAAQVDSRFPI